MITRKPQGSKFAILAEALLLLLAYGGAYFATSTPDQSIDYFYRNTSVFMTTRVEPRYRFMQSTLEILFWPLARLDPRERETYAMVNEGR